MKVDLVQHTPDLIPFLAKIASICYNSDPKNQMGLIKHLYESGHHSVFEHAWFTGVSKVLVVRSLTSWCDTGCAASHSVHSGIAMKTDLRL